MIIGVFFLALVVCTFLTNKKNDAQATDAVLEFERSDSLMIFGCFVSSVFVQFVVLPLVPFMRDNILAVSGVFGLLYACIMVLVNVHRERKIQRDHEQILRVYQSLADIFGNVQPEDVDFANVPFAFEEDKKLDTINKIIIDTTKPGLKINDNTIIYAQYSLNKYFPDLQWISEHDAPNRQLIYTGLAKPPSIAHWPWSDYRAPGWIPIGLGGGPKEICWNMADEKDPGHSSYLDENGNVCQTMKMPSAPQCLTVGSTGGGKAIWVGQVVELLKNN